MATVHYAGHRFTTDELTGARIAGTAQGYANLGRSGAISVPDINGALNHMILGAGVALLVIRESNLTDGELEEAENVVLQRFPPDSAGEPNIW